MRPPPRDPVTDLEELRRLLISREQDELRELRATLADKEQRARDVSSVLPQAVKLSRERSSELTNALLPAVEISVRDSIAKRPQVFVDALHPIIGSVVRRSIAESLRGLLQSFNQTLEHTFSWRGLKWRVEALRTGRSFAEVVMLRSLVFRVEQLFLIHRETSLSLLHVSADRAATQDSDMVAGMLSAIQDFVRDSFKTGHDANLEEFRVGELQVWIAPGQHAYLAAVIRGNPPREFRTTLEETIESVHILKASVLADFQGDAAEFASLRPELETCLRAQYAKKSGEKRKGRAWFVIAALTGLLVASLIVAFRREAQWDDFISRLRAQPGITVTEAERGWISRSQVAGLRDPLSSDPVTIAQEAKLNPDGIKFSWKDYHALDSALVLERFRNAYPPPPTVTAKVEQGMLLLAGSSPYEWIVPVREGAPRLPGIRGISEDALQVVFQAKPLIQRFTSKFGLPDGVEASVGPRNTLVLTGEATHSWLGRVRLGAKEIPGITEIDDQKMIDLDLQTFKQTKSVIESAFIYFLVDKDNFATEGFTALSRLPDEIRRCLTAAKRLGYETSIQIQGHADSTGSEAKNADLSQRRADAVLAFLIACGFDREMFQAVGLGAPARSTQGAAEQSDRRVAFKVITKPVAVAP